jgi:hypothetical protein
MGNRGTRVLAAVAAGAMAGGLGLAGASAPQGAGAPGGLAGGAAVRGTQLRVSRYSGLAAVVAAGPDGKTVFVTGTTTIAYQAGTGALLWAARYQGPRGGVSPRWPSARTGRRCSLPASAVTLLRMPTTLGSPTVPLPGPGCGPGSEGRTFRRGGGTFGPAASGRARDKPNQEHRGREERGTALSGGK